MLEKLGWLIAQLEDTVNPINYQCILETEWMNEPFKKIEFLLSVI